MKYGSFFSGIDIVGHAAQAEGFDLVFGCENDPFCRRELEANFPEMQLFGDITEVQNIPYVDFLSFGFPCQDASIAAPIKIKNPLIDGKRTSLFWEAMRLIRTNKPKALLFENVAQLKDRGWETVIKEVASCGYHVGYATIRAADFGAMFEKKRLFGVAFDNSFGWEAVVRVLNRVVEEAKRTRAKKSDLEWQFRRTMGQYTQLETEFRHHGKDRNTPYWLLQGLRAKTIGNFIYPPVASSFVRQIKKELIHDSISI
jgi:DNA-cytosine methyltransferase